MSPSGENYAYYHGLPWPAIIQKSCRNSGLMSCKVHFLDDYSLDD